MQSDLSVLRDKTTPLSQKKGHLDESKMLIFMHSNRADIANCRCNSQTLNEDLLKQKSSLHTSKESS